MLVSGGTGALGLLVACWLRSSCPTVPLVLLGRTGRCSAAISHHLWVALIMGNGQARSIITPACGQIVRVVFGADHCVCMHQYDAPSHRLLLVPYW